MLATLCRTGWRQVFEISRYWFSPIYLTIGLVVSFLASYIPGGLLICVYNIALHVKANDLVNDTIIIRFPCVVHSQVSLILHQKGHLHLCTSPVLVLLWALPIKSMML